jgi:hypothetical protein
MNARERATLDVRLIISLIIVLIAAHCGAPAASAQTAIIAGSMNSNLPVRPGDTIRVGYEVSLADASASSTATTISVTSAVVLVSVTCPKGASQTITINIPAQSFSVTANTSNWSSSANAYQGQTRAPSNLCGGLGGTTNGATFTATSSVGCHANSEEGCCHNVCFRFHCQYQDQGGSFSDRSCKPEKQCESPEKREHGPCCREKD